MTTQQDVSIGFKKETTFGTAVTVDKFVEFVSEDFAWNPEFTESRAMRYGRRVLASNRRVLKKESVGGSLEVEATTKGLGALFEAALGTGTSTLISGSAYQQVFTPTTTDPLNSYTIQKGIPLVGGGAAQPMTFNGMVCTGFELDAPNGDVPTIKFPFVGRGVDTAAAFATPSYPAAYELFSFVGATIKAGGVVVVPGTNTLATGGTAVADVLSANIKFDNGVDDGGYFMGGSGKRGRKPAVGLRGITGTITAEYDANTFRDAFLAQTDLALVLQFEHNSIITGAIKPTLQITIPVIRLDGELPKAASDGVVTQTLGFTGLDGQVATNPIYVAIITAETAI